MTMGTSCCALRTEPRGSCMPRKSRSARRIISISVCTENSADSNGTKGNRTPCSCNGRTSRSKSGAPVRATSGRRQRPTPGLRQPIPRDTSRRSPTFTVILRTTCVPSSTAPLPTPSPSTIRKSRMGSAAWPSSRRPSRAPGITPAGQHWDKMYS